METVGGIAKRKAGEDGNKRKRHPFAERLKLVEDPEGIYHQPLLIYDTVPDLSLSVGEFEKFAVARLRLLRALDKMRTSSTFRYSDDWMGEFRKEVKGIEECDFHTLAVLGGGTNPNLTMYRKFDHISHYLLRLAFSGTEEQRRWFVAMEMEWFRLKAAMAGVGFWLKDWMERIKFPGTLVSEQEKEKYKDELSANFKSPSHNLVSADVYKIHFLHALDLVRKRAVFMKGGYAYVHFNGVTNVIAGQYRSFLSESMSMIAKNIHVVEQDDRISSFIRNFEKRHTGSNYLNSNSSSGIRLEELTDLSKKSFPLCMKNLYDVLSKEHHMKHFGRLQLGLFMKGIGVTLEQSVTFWRSHLTKRPDIDANRFDKQYLYNIRHMYGQEGRRADYTPYTCLKVIHSSVGPGEHHGCPFRHFDNKSLHLKLSEAKIPSEGIKEISDLASNHHYQIACTKYYEYMHAGSTPSETINHPNQYLEESTNLLSGGKTVKAKNQVKTKKVNVYSQPKEEPEPDVESQAQIQAQKQRPTHTAEGHEITYDDEVIPEDLKILMKEEHGFVSMPNTKSEEDELDDELMEAIINSKK